MSSNQTKQTSLTKPYTPYNNSTHYNNPYNKFINAVTEEAYRIAIDMDILNAVINALGKKPRKTD